MLVRAWKECAGPALQQQAVFLGIHPEGAARVLRLQVEDPLWRQELSLQTSSILETYRAKLLSLGFTEAEMPTHCSITSSVVTTSKVPFKSRDPKNSRNKVRVK